MEAKRLFYPLMNKRAKQHVYFQLLFLFLLFAQFSRAQETSQEKHRYLGFGINLNNLESGVFRINFDPIKYLRTEVQFATQKSSEEVFYMNPNGQNQTAELDSKYNQFAIGLYGTYPFAKALFYAGLAYRQSKDSYESLDYGFIFPYSEGVVNNQTSSKQYGPVIGAEYRFGNRFSLGAELGYWLGKQINTPGYTNSTPTESKSNLTQTSLFFRFFPF